MQLGCVSFRSSSARRVRDLGLAGLAGLLLLVAAGCGAGASSEASPYRWDIRGRRLVDHGVAVPPGTGRRPRAPAPQTATVVPASGARTVQNGHADPASKFDCFYVYPTVSSQKSANADLTVQPAEVDAAIAQVSRFSSVCRVWAPMYHQRTSISLLSGLGANPEADTVAYRASCPGGRTISRTTTTAGPSSSSATHRVPPCSSGCCPAKWTRTRNCAPCTVVAILAGGNVTVPIGQGRRGDVPSHAALHGGVSDRVRDRVLELSFAAAGELESSACRAKGSASNPGRRRRTACRWPA